MSSHTSTGSWHVSGDDLRAWVHGVAGPLVSISVEQHVQRCHTCQAAVNDLVPATDLPAWDAVLAAVEQPPPSRAEAALVRLGMRPSDARVVSATPTLRTGWLLGTIGVLAFVVVATALSEDGGRGLFLLVAPLIPVTGVALAYGPASDPSYEVVVSSPYAMIRLVLLRTIAVLTTSVPLVAGAGLVAPGAPWLGVGWLLPAAGFVAVVLTASTWVDPLHASIAVALGWLVAIGWALRVDDPLAVFAPAALAAYVVILGVSVATLLHRLLGATPSWRLR